MPRKKQTNNQDLAPEMAPGLSPGPSQKPARGETRTQMDLELGQFRMILKKQQALDRTWTVGYYKIYEFKKS